MDAVLESDEIALRPYGRAGAVIRFAVRRERGALLRVSLPDGSPLPAGAQVRVEGGIESHVAVTGGEVYLPNLTGSARLSASWAGGQCSFVLIVPASDDPQPRIDDIVCGREVYVAR
jgi:outer membrane usher protein